MSTVETIVKARDYSLMVPFGEYPNPGEYVITGIQHGNVRGERGWQYYVGYVVQVRRKAGAYGSDMVLLRHPDGTLMVHENQLFVRMSRDLRDRVISLFPEDLTPESEDYSKPYTLAGGKYPAIGRVIDPPKEHDKSRDPDYPLMKITVCHADGGKTVEVV